MRGQNRRGPGRWRELGLLAFPIAIALAGMGWLALVRQRPLASTELALAAAVGLLLLGTHLWLAWRLPAADQFLLPAVAGLCAVGLVMVARLRPDLAVRQTVWIGIGLVAMAATIALLPSTAWLKRYRYLWALGGLGLVVLTFVLGDDPNGSGARLWIGAGSVYFQPSEVLKVLLAVFFAAYLDEYRNLLAFAGPRVGPFRLPPAPYLMPMVLMFALSQAVLVLQRDLGAALLFFGVFVAMLCVASGRAEYLPIGIGMFAGGAWVAYLLFPHVRVRVEVWLDPWSRAETEGFQVVQALMALASGGIAGSGLGNGYPMYVPAVHTDFVIVAVGEELGLVGTLPVLAMYAVLVHRGLAVALAARDTFSSLLAMGLTSVLGLQTLIILGGTLKLVPLTGITLPFVSYGGSSLLANFVMLGLLLKTSHESLAPGQDPGPRLRRGAEHLGLFLLAGLAATALALGYWQAVAGPSLAADARNPRLLETEARVQRGAFLDRNGTVLAVSERSDGRLVRRYADPSLAHLVGYHSLRFGDTNLEQVFDSYLGGQRARWLQEHIEAVLFPGRSLRGADVQLTIDLRLQEAAAQALGDARGALVALDPRTGEVLALVSRPDFDPNRLDGDWEVLNGRSDAPLFNRALQATYTPGSIFKIVTAAAAVDLGQVDLEKPFSCTRPVLVDNLQTDCRNNAHLPRLTFKEAFAWSSNRTFALAGLALGSKGPINPWLDDAAGRPYPWEKEGIQASAQRLEEYAARFGFGRRIPFDLQVAQGQVKQASEWTPALLAQTAFGQGQLALSPMQAALMAATIANGGLMPEPYVVWQVRFPAGDVWEVHRPGRAVERVMRPEAAAIMNDFMVEAVDRGYASQAAIPGIKVGGKTGTAEVGEGRTPHAWFVGYAPADAPRIAVAVIMENRGSGGEWAAPAARQVMELALQLHTP